MKSRKKLFAIGLVFSVTVLGIFEKSHSQDESFHIFEVSTFAGR